MMTATARSITFPREMNSLKSLNMGTPCRGTGLHPVWSVPGRVAAMAEPLVHVERSDDGVATIRLQNGKVNSLSTSVLRELRGAALELAADPPGAVIVTGSDRIFAAGADISEFAGPDEARAIGGLFLEALGAVAAIPRVVIAAVSG